MSKLPSYRQRRRWSHVEVEGGSGEGGKTGGGERGGGERGGGERGGGRVNPIVRVDVVELEPQRGAPLLHEAHMELLMEALGPTALRGDDDDEEEEEEEDGREEAAAAASSSPLNGASTRDHSWPRGRTPAAPQAPPLPVRPWSVYAEALEWPASLPLPLPSGDPGEAVGAGGAGGAGGWNATAEIYSLDTPLLLSFATEHGVHAALAARGEDDDDDDDDEEEEEEEVDDDEAARLANDVAAPVPMEKSMDVS